MDEEKEQEFRKAASEYWHTQLRYSEAKADKLEATEKLEKIMRKNWSDELNEDEILVAYGNILYSYHPNNQPHQRIKFRALDDVVSAEEESHEGGNQDGRKNNQTTRTGK